MRTWFITGGLGFIGSNFVRLVLRERPDVRVVNYDAMTYAGNPANLEDVANDPRYRFVHGDICDARALADAIPADTAALVNFAAETHVDRSILDPEAFLRTGVLGVRTLLEAVRDRGISRFVHVSTDEVYGEVAEGHSKETDALAPRSPYAASKAAGDLLILAYGTTYGTPVLVTRGSNTYGPYQYPEKLIPLFTTNLIDDQTVPLYGDGLQVRDWLHVEDHARGILHVLEHGAEQQVYNLGGGNARTNREITMRLVDLCGRRVDTHVRHVVDRPGHDRRYSVDCAKANALGWTPARDFERGLSDTVDWYRAHESWWRAIKSGAFAEYYEKQYAGR
jgi:dTDP-glucose 4,6-dehydratase